MRTTILLFASALCLAACAAPAADPDDNEELEALAASGKGDAFDWNAGTLRYGDEPFLIEHTGAPRYRVLHIEGRAGDEINVSLRSVDGRARGWLFSPSLELLANGVAEVGDGVSTLSLRATLAEAGAHEVIFREELDRPARFTARMSGRSILVQCEADTECTAVPTATCCPSGKLAAVNTSQVEAYRATRPPRCNAVMCPPVQLEDPRVALCVNRTCQMMAPHCASPERSVASRDQQKCQATLFDCKLGMVPFFDACGCGCAPE